MSILWRTKSDTLIFFENGVKFKAVVKMRERKREKEKKGERKNSVLRTLGRL